MEVEGVDLVRSGYIGMGFGSLRETGLAGDYWVSGGGATSANAWQFLVYGSEVLTSYGASSRHAGFSLRCLQE